MKTSKEANDCARAITALVEKTTGAPLPFEACMKIVSCVQAAMNVATAGALDEALNSGDGTYRP